MRHKLFLIIVGILGTVILLSYIVGEFTGTFAIPKTPGDFQEEFGDHIVRLGQEIVIQKEFPPSTVCGGDFSSIRSISDDIKTKSSDYINAISGSAQEQRAGLIKLIFETEATRNDACNDSSLAEARKSAAEKSGGESPRNFTKNPFRNMTVDDARVVYHDMVNCYFNIATDVHMTFTLDKAMGKSDSDHKADNKLDKAEIYDIAPLGYAYCTDLYDNVPLINEGNGSKHMTDFANELLESVKKSGEKDPGFTRLIGDQALELYENYVVFLQNQYQQPYPAIVPGVVYRQETTINELSDKITLQAEVIRREAELAKEGLMAALNAYQSFNETFAVHVQMQKLKHRSDQFRRGVAAMQWSLIQLNNKFTNASVKGGKR